MFLRLLTRDSQGKMVALQCVLRPAKPQDLLLLQCKICVLDCNKSGSWSEIDMSNHCSVCVALAHGYMTTTRTTVQKAW